MIRVLKDDRGMNYKTLDDIQITEPISTHISVPCTQAFQAKYNSIARRLEDKKKKKILTKLSREALEKVLTDLEQLLEAS